MLNSKYRFHSRGGVRYVYSKGKTIRTPTMSLGYCDNTRGFQRFAVVVSKKVMKSAVGRNRIRRRVYEAIRSELTWYDHQKDCIFVIYDARIINAPFRDIQKQIHSLLEQSLLS